MKAGSPRGVPNTTIPCCDGGKSVSPDPRQTRALGSAACAILSNASHPSGLIPLRFQTCVLPPWTRIRAWENKLRCRDPYTLLTRSGTGDTTQMSSRNATKWSWSTSANFDFGQFFFRVRPVRLRPISTSANFDFGQFRLRPISTSANFDFGQF